MLNLAQFNLPLLAAVLLIGVATGRWIFRGPPQLSKTEDEVSS